MGRESLLSHTVSKRDTLLEIQHGCWFIIHVTNHGKVKKNDIVFDPFVGTGILFNCFKLM